MNLNLYHVLIYSEAEEFLWLCNLCNVIRLRVSGGYDKIRSCKMVNYPDKAPQPDSV